MARILPNGRRPSGCPVAICLGLATLLVAGMAHATTQEDPPDGLPAGPVFFAPWFQTEVLGDDNIFRRSEEQQQLFQVDGLEDSDISTTLRAGVTAYIPIRVSMLELGYEGSTFAYKESSFAGTDRHTGNLKFELNFSSFNTLRIEETYTDGYTELQQYLDPDQPDDEISRPRPEIIRQGVPFTSNAWALEWQRKVTGRPGWRARVERSYLRYRPEELPVQPEGDEDDQRIPWNDYVAWDVEYEYAQPVYRRGELTAMYTGRREDEFVPGGPAESDFLRREEYDALEIGFRGLVGRRQPLFARLGYGRFLFRDVQPVPGTGELQQPSNYRGLVGNITWRLPVGGLSNMAVNVNRRPLASFYNTNYIVNELRVFFDRRYREVSRWGVNALASFNGYGDLISTETANGVTTGPCAVGGTPVIRHDRNQQIQGYWEWFVQSRMAVRALAAHTRRNSSCDNGDFSSNAISLTFRVGWF